MSEPSPTCPLLSVVIPAYRRRESVLTLLEDVFRQDHPSFEVIVVEDCGGDGTTEAVAERFPQVVLLRNLKNSGPAVSRNRGIQAARSELVVGFDSDVTVPDPQLLTRVAATFAERSEVTGLAFRLLQPDGQTEDTARWWHPVPIQGYANKRFQTSYFSGTAYAFRKAAVLAAGLFPEILYMHYEEVELAYRILDQGGSIQHCPDLIVRHHANEVSRRSEVQVFYKPRNQVLVAAACFPIMRAVSYLMPRLVYQLFIACRQRHFTGFLRAMRSASRLLPVRLRNRRPLQRETFYRMKAMRRGMTVPA